jgi:hypothetical protein
VLKSTTLSDNGLMSACFTKIGPNNQVSQIGFPWCKESAFSGCFKGKKKGRLRKLQTAFIKKEGILIPMITMIPVVMTVTAIP